jgi:hypothetical protein
MKPTIGDTNMKEIDIEQFEGHTMDGVMEVDPPSIFVKMTDGSGDRSREIRVDGGIVAWLIMDDYPSAEANLKLILSAPELLKEVKQLRKKIDNVFNALI